MNLDFDNLSRMIEQGYISVRKHPSAGLFIYNYTAKTQYEKVWNNETLHCRGLVLDVNRKVVARPFKKFFNLEEVESLPDESFEVFEKLDGSLIILFFHENTVYLASRGSFDSDQAKVARSLFYSNYAETLPRLNQDFTYLFEVIYPENRVVVDYGGKRELVLLAVVDTKTGNELGLDAELGFPIAKRFDGVADLAAIAREHRDNEEGFVVKFVGGLRVKMKYEEYKRLHRIITQCSSKIIWELLKDNKPLDELLEKVPDEFYSWVKQQKLKLESEYQAIENTCKSDFKVLSNRKETALYFTACQYPHVLFAMLDSHDYSEMIWKLLKPKYERPFRSQEEEC